MYTPNTSRFFLALFFEFIFACLSANAQEPSQLSEEIQTKKVEQAPAKEQPKTLRNGLPPTTMAEFVDVFKDTVEMLGPKGSVLYVKLEADGYHVVSFLAGGIYHLMGQDVDVSKIPRLERHMLCPKDAEHYFGPIPPASDKSEPQKDAVNRNEHKSGIPSSSFRPKSKARPMVVPVGDFDLHRPGYPSLNLKKAE